MSDYNCPHCNEPYEASEGPYEEDKPDEIECDSCGQTFLCYVHYVVTYDTKCLPDNHDFKVQPFKDTLIAICRNCREVEFVEHRSLQSPAGAKAFAEYQSREKHND